ncbi:unnamed protein product, partial [marine sediment metagenome]
QNIQSLPARVKKNLSPGLQRVFLRVFNQAYQTYKNDSRAFRIAWGVIKKIARQNKQGKWVRKAKAKITKAIIEKVLEKEQEEIFAEEEKKVVGKALKMKKLEVVKKQAELLDKLLGKNKK